MRAARRQTDVATSLAPGGGRCGATGERSEFSPRSIELACEASGGAAAKESLVVDVAAQAASLRLM